MIEPANTTAIKDNAPVVEQAEASDSKLEKLHRVLLMMLKDFAAICAEENLAWCINYGTAIGALRHGGFIPWDDDLDLCMPRADLERLVPIMQEKHADKYSVVNFTINPNYPMATTRIMLKGTEFRDSALATMDFESGIFLDLFPLDVLADDENAREKQLKDAWLNNKLAIAKLAANPYIAGKGIGAIALKSAVACAHGILNAPGVRAIDFNKRALAALLRYQNETTAFVGFPCDTDRHWNVFEVADIVPLRTVSFEDIEVPAPQRIEKILTRIYGDYMTPPPADMRREHYPDILDFGPYDAL